MDMLASGRVKTLIAANLVAVALLFASGGPASAGDEWETYCPPEATGCDCLYDWVWGPDGCYDNAGEEFLCSSNQYCWDQPH